MIIEFIKKNGERIELEVLGPEPVNDVWLGELTAYLSSQPNFDSVVRNWPGLKSFKGISFL